MSLRPILNSWRRRLPILPLAALAVVLAAGPARAGLVVSAESVPASAGVFDVILTNTGGSAVGISGFSFEVNVDSAQVTFTDATTATTDPYIFAGTSLFGPDITRNITNGGETLDALDISFGGNQSVGAGQSVGLGHVFFSVSGTLPGPATVSFTAYPATGLADSGGNNVPIDTLTSGTISPAGTVPEPSTLVLATTALALFGATQIVRRRRQNSPVSVA
jgi:hypothetical protein